MLWCHLQQPLVLRSVVSITATPVIAYGELLPIVVAAYLWGPQ